MGKISKKMEITRKNKNTRDKKISSVTKIKNAFEGLLSRLDIYEGRISELQDLKTYMRKEFLSFKILK